MAQPINEELEQVLFGRMSAAEKSGVKVLKSLKVKKLSSNEIQDIVRKGSSGELHYLTSQERKRVNMLHYVCVLQALAIGLLTTAFPGLLENYLVRTYETDGAKDAYWTCPGAENNQDALPSDMQPPYHNLSLASCPYGLCTSVPANITEYLLMGSEWTNEQPLTDTCGIVDEDITCPPQESCAASSWKLCSKTVELQCSPLASTPIALDRLGLFWIFNGA